MSTEVYKKYAFINELRKQFRLVGFDAGKMGDVELWSDVTELAKRGHNQIENFKARFPETTKPNGDYRASYSPPAIARLVRQDDPICSDLFLPIR